MLFAPKSLQFKDKTRANRKTQTEGNNEATLISKIDFGLSTPAWLKKNFKESEND